MSWEKTYTHTLAVAVDILAASVIWNRYDVTISSMCGLALRKPAAPFFRLPGLATLQLLGKGLNKLQANHCELAIAADRARAVGTINFLGPDPRPLLK